MSKILQGKIISDKSAGTAVVEVTRVVPHPLYKKLLTKSKKFSVDTKGQKVELGQVVKIIESRPISASKHFVLLADDKKAKAEADLETKSISGQKKVRKLKKEEGK